jgi:hypothetical protein
MKLKRFTQFITESRDETEEQMGDYGLGPSTFTWDVKYDEDMRAYENADRQATYNYESPTGDHVIRVEGIVTKFETKLRFKLSDSTIYAHVNFQKSARSTKSRVILTMTYSTPSGIPEWLTVFGGGIQRSPSIPTSEPTGNAKEWLDLVKQHNSAVWPIFYYCNEFLKNRTKSLDNKVTESRDETEEQMGDYGLGPSTFTWDVKYDEDTQNMERSDRQSMYDYESPTGAHVTKVEGVIEAFQTKLTVDLSDGDIIQLHIKFSQHPGDKGRAMFNIRQGGGVYEAPKWKLLFGHRPDESAGKAEEWLDKVEDTGSAVKPIFYYYEEFLKIVNR